MLKMSNERIHITNVQQTEKPTMNELLLI